MMHFVMCIEYEYEHEHQHKVSKFGFHILLMRVHEFGFNPWILYKIILVVTISPVLNCIMFF